MDLGLDGRVALVTGASRGLGCDIAECLAHEGTHVAIAYRQSHALAEAVAARIRSAGGTAMTVPLELDSESSICAAVARVGDTWDRIDILVNNAVQWADRSILTAPPFEDVPSEEWRRLVRINLEGPYMAMQAVVPWMRRRRWGRVVNVSAVVAHDGIRGGGWYAASKMALHGVTRSFAREVGVEGILANVVMPGLLLTERTRDHLSQPLLDESARATAIGRLLTPAEVATLVAFLCSAANASITGEVIRATGGFVQPCQVTPVPLPEWLSS